MTRIVYEGAAFECRQGETVLEALLRQGQSPPFSCRHGSCLVCMRRCTEGEPPESSQRALRPSLRRAGYFLPCRCLPTGDMVIEPPRAADLYAPAVVQAKERVAPDVCRLVLESATSLYYHAGQFVNLRRADGLTRSYSLASLPSEDSSLELHVKRMPGGAMSSWIFDELAVGDELEFQGPNGRCYYVPGTQAQNLLLIGNGTGAAPLIGIVRDALHVGHRGRIRLLHGSRSAAGLYLHDAFEHLAARYSNFEYVPCVSGPEVPEGFTRGRAHLVAFSQPLDLGGWRVFVAGHPQMVADVEVLARASGASPTVIHSDPYDLRAEPETVKPGAPRTRPPSMIAEGSSGKTRRGALGPPDPELWEALGRGALMRVVLTDFYTQVFEDAVLAPYFKGVTKERLIGQVYSFMRDVLAGEKSYFGMRPRTAHHWMVISDEVFDHREKMMEACLRRHGLAEHLVQRWRRFEEGFRPDIVKATAWRLVVDGVAMPLEGFGEDTLLAGGICDGCQRVIEVGERVRYHLRLGLTYCPACAVDGERSS